MPGFKLIRVSKRGPWLKQGHFLLKILITSYACDFCALRNINVLQTVLEQARHFGKYDWCLSYFMINPPFYIRHFLTDSQMTMFDVQSQVDIMSYFGKCSDETQLYQPATERWMPTVKSGISNNYYRDCSCFFHCSPKHLQVLGIPNCSIFKTSTLQRIFIYAYGRCHKLVFQWKTTYWTEETQIQGSEWWRDMRHLLIKISDVLITHCGLVTPI